MGLATRAQPHPYDVTMGKGWHSHAALTGVVLRPRPQKKSSSSSQLVRQQGGILGRACGEGNVVATRARRLLFTALYKSRYTRSGRWSE
jgi:hypothetical protein